MREMGKVDHSAQRLPPKGDAHRPEFSLELFRSSTRVEKKEKARGEKKSCR